MISRKRNSQSGMTLIEVLMSLAILSLLALPIASYFTIAAGTRADSQSVAKATIYAENLLNDIKEQIDTDVKGQRDEESRPDFDASGSVKPRTGIRDYVMKTKNIDQTDASSTFKYELKDYLNKDETKFNTEYETDKYAYQAVVWRLDEETLDYISSLTPGSDKMLEWSPDSIKRGLQVFNNSNYDFVTETVINEQIKFNLPAALLDDSFIPKDKYLSGQVERGGDKNYAVVIPINQDGTLDVSNIVDHDLILTRKELKRTNSDSVSASDTRKYYKLEFGGSGRRTILIDATKVSTMGSSSIGNNGLTLEIQNNVSDQLVVQVRKSLDKKVDDLDKFLRFSPVTDNNTVIERPKDIEVEDAYLIALIVRDLNPSNGKKGKVIKKMIEVYSYDHAKM